MNPKPQLYYELRTVFGMTSLLPALMLPAYLLLATLNWISRETTPTLIDAQRAFVLILPLGVGLLAAHLMTVEQEEGIDELRRTYPEQDSWLPRVRTVGAILLGMLSASVSVLLLRITGAFALSETLLPAIPPSLLLLGLGMVLNNFSRSAALSVLVIIGYWFIELQTQGRITGVLFLFQSLIPQPEVNTNINQVLLSGIGALLLILNGFYSSWRRRGRG
jgi:hypothetical protein